MLTLNNISTDLMGETIVHDLSLSVKAGEVVCLYGPSGCGKTTILRLIAGLIDLDEGTIQNTFASTTYLFQEHRLLPWRTVWENIALVRKDSDTKPIRQKIADILHQLNLDESDWHKYPHELSGGMRQRVSLGRALITEPQLLLMDEPFSALDFDLKQNLQDLILQRVQQNEMSVILVTHDRQEVLRMVNKLYILTDEKPTQYQRIVTLDTPFKERDVKFVETHLKPHFWEI